MFWTFTYGTCADVSRSDILTSGLSAILTATVYRLLAWDYSKAHGLD